MRCNLQCLLAVQLYRLLQVSTCAFASLAHGANDTANAIGPLATAWMVCMHVLVMLNVSVWI
jgi:phosphate/sulfate permease